MNQTEIYLRTRFAETKWPYYSLSYTRFDVGDSFVNDIVELREKEMVKPTPGLNGWLIEIVCWESKWNNPQSK
jgi:hypothetical protein